MKIRCFRSTQKEVKSICFLVIILAVMSLLSFVSGCGVTVAPQDSITTAANPSASGSDKLRVSYIDVGQGDSILIQIPNGKNVLIDAGDNDQGEKVVSYLNKQGVKRLDVAIWTHPHADHIGGADTVTKAFEIGQVVMPKQTSTTESYRSLIKAISQKGLKITEAKAGVILDLGPEVKAELLAPSSGSYEEVNNYSAVLRLTYGNTTFLFTGDAQSESEKEMIKTGQDLKADVLKVGHHGSLTSTTSAFLNKVQPKYAVISVGKDNDYGHPAESIITRLNKAGVNIYRTDESGTLVFESDGKDITLIEGR